jgi:hypothetical protein
LLNVTFAKHEPASAITELSYWRVIRPKGFEPGITTAEGLSKAAKACFNAVPATVNRPDFDDSVHGSIVEINIGDPFYHPGGSIAGKRAERYDIAVRGNLLLAVHFTCLLSPMLDAKAIQLK